MTGDPKLLRLIQARLAQQGEVSFAWVMEQALYHPRWGYYVAERPRTGRSGDFLTSVSVGPVFGSVLADQINELLSRIGATDPLVILEQGAEDGQLADDLLRAWAEPRNRPFVEYWIIEPIAHKQRGQQKRLEHAPVPVRWFPSPRDLPRFRGVLIANELLDAFPVHLVEYREGVWWELMVREERQELILSPVFLQDARLRESLAGIIPPTGWFRTEVNLAMGEWLQQIDARMEQGFCLLLDYGYLREEPFPARPASGSIRAYARHRVQQDPLRNLGQADLTSDVDFSALIALAESLGWQLIGFTDQHHFLVGAGEIRFRGLEQGIPAQGVTPAQQKLLRQYLTLLHPASFGSAFKVLLLGKGVSPTTRPSGFRYGSGQPRVPQFKS